MKEHKIPYSHFPNFVLRTPLLPLNYFQTLTKQEKVTDEQIKKVFKDPIVNEALFLASPSLHSEAQKWCNEKSANDRLKFSLLKYVSRMSSRCTPFGLFAGCSLGEFGEASAIVLQDPSKNKRHTRLDMNYLVALSQDLSKKDTIREQLLFYPNSSHYISGNQLRYVEYTYVNSRRQHHIVAADYTPYLKTILDQAKGGSKLIDLSNLLVDDEITHEEASDFINELVDNQVLISELEPSVSGPEFMAQILKVLRSLENSESLVRILKEVDTSVQSLDSKLGNDTERYLQLSEFLKQLETENELKFLFQTDMELSTTSNQLDLSVIKNVKKGLALLNSITAPPKETLITKFSDAFYERYESREVSIANALDVEIGVGYKQDQGNGDVNPLVDDLVIPPKIISNPSQELELNSFDHLINQKLIHSYKNQDHVIKLTDEDVKDFTQGWDDLPDTLSTMIEVVHIDGDMKIKFSGASGSSAANLLGRFCHGNQNLNEFTQLIANKEAQMNPQKILAEIVHLPESRVGNILMRPKFRGYEIPYLAQSTVPQDHQLLIEDLAVSAGADQKIKLRSRRLNMEVIPRLTNAHNYSSNSLPIYHFLADMQSAGKRSGIYFNLSPLANNYAFIPRIEYENLILHRATWNLKKSDIDKLKITFSNDEKLMKEITTFLKEHNIPQYVLLSEGDNELLINFNNLTSLRMFLETVKNKDRFTITEFLFDENAIVKSEKGYYSHQIVLAFYNAKKLDQQTEKS